MNWLGYASPDGIHFAANANANPATRGTICADAEFDASEPVQHLFTLDFGQGTRLVAQFETSSQAKLTVRLHHLGQVQCFAVPGPTPAHLDKLRISVSWDQDLARGRLSINAGDALIPQTAIGPVLPQLSVDDWKHVLQSASETMSRQVDSLAISRCVEPISPLPTMISGTPVQTDCGARPIETLTRGDIVRCVDGTLMPVLHRIDYCAPARGFFAPVTLHAPFLGLQQDIHVAPAQRIVMRGSDVEYTFGQEAVLVSAASLVGGRAARFQTSDPWVTFHQVLLPKTEVLDVAGAGLESMFIGRLRRKPNQLRQTILNGLDRFSLPEHAQSPMPALFPSEARRFLGPRAVSSVAI